MTKYLSILLPLLKATNGGKTYAAALGLVGLGVYHLCSTEDSAKGVELLMAGLAVFGVGHKQDRTPGDVAVSLGAAPEAPAKPEPK